MHNWQENEIKELLTIRGPEAIRNQTTGTVKDSVVYNRMTTLLAEKGGGYRSHVQVISKLKALRKQYSKNHLQNTRCGRDRVDWPFYEQCHRVFGNAHAGNPLKRHRSPTPPPPPVISDEHQEVVVGLWDEADDGELNKHLACTTPSKKKKTTVMEQVFTLVSVTVTQLREMDASMRVQEDARLQRLMDHEKERQNNLISQLVAMHERIS